MLCEGRVSEEVVVAVSAEWERRWRMADGLVYLLL